MKFIIWGSGTRGKRIFSFLGEDKVEAFIDSNETLQEMTCCDKPVISFDMYQHYYRKYFIIITPVCGSDEIEELLLDQKIYSYFKLVDAPNGFYEYDYEELMSFICKKFKNDNGNAIYGVNLFSILLYEYVKKRNFINISIVADEKMELEKFNWFKKKFNDFELNLTKKIECGTKNIFLTVKESIEFKNISDYGEYHIENFFKLSIPRNKYHNPQIEQFKNKHKGKRCFIVATGPSLTMQDLNKLNAENEICISMNMIFYAFKNTNWRPDYYVMTDPVGIKSYEKEICEIDVKHKFISDNYPEFWRERRSENIHKTHIFFDDYLPEKPKFTEDFSKGAYSTCNVTYICLQLAVYMGCKEIILLGVDFNGVVGQKNVNTHFSELYGQKMYASNENIRLKGQYQESQMLLFHRCGYEKTKQYARDNNIKIYNATRGGKLEIFERVQFDSLFENK